MFPGPQSQRGIRGVAVAGRPGADLHRGLLQRQRQQPHGGEFLAAGPAGVVPLAGRDVLGDAAQPSEPFSRVGDLPGLPVDHGAAVVDGVLEHRPGQHQPVGEGDGDTHRSAGGVQALAGDRTVQVQGVRGEPVHGGDHHRPPAGDRSEVGDQPGVEHRIQRLSVGPPQVPVPAMPGPLGRRQRQLPAGGTIGRRPGRGRTGGQGIAPAWHRARLAGQVRGSCAHRCLLVGLSVPARCLGGPGASRVLAAGQSWRVSRNTGNCRVVRAWAAPRSGDPAARLGPPWTLRYPQ